MFRGYIRRVSWGMMFPIRIGARGGYTFSVGWGIIIVIARAWNASLEVTIDGFVRETIEYPRGS